MINRPTALVQEEDVYDDDDDDDKCIHIYMDAWVGWASR
jgi:hypothetical protein